MVLGAGAANWSELEQQVVATRLNKLEGQTETGIRSFRIKAESQGDKRSLQTKSDAKARRDAGAKQCLHLCLLTGLDLGTGSRSGFEGSMVKQSL